MADTASGGEPRSFWGALRQLLKLSGPTSLRESIEEAIEEHLPPADEDSDDLDLAERAMLRRMLDLADRRAGDIAVPRSEVISVDEGLDLAAVIALFRESGHSRLPVHRGSLDEVLGMLHVKDVYALLADRHAGDQAPWPPVATLLRPVIFVPAAMPVTDLLAEMQRKRTHMAMVVDEYGGTDGLATIEDIVEEIVGEIEDEHDEAEELLTRLPDGIVEADARIELDVLAATTGVGFEEGDLEDEVDTLGGLAVLLAGRVPEAGDAIHHPNGWQLQILASNGRRVERLRLIPPPARDAAVEDVNQRIGASR